MIVSIITVYNWIIMHNSHGYFIIFVNSWSHMTLKITESEFTILKRKQNSTWSSTLQSQQQLIGCKWCTAQLNISQLSSSKPTASLCFVWGISCISSTCRWISYQTPTNSSHYKITTCQKRRNVLKYELIFMQSTDDIARQKQRVSTYRLLAIINKCSAKTHLTNMQTPAFLPGTKRHPLTLLRDTPDTKLAFLPGTKRQTLQWSLDYWVCHTKRQKISILQATGGRCRDKPQTYKHILRATFWRNDGL